MPVTELGSLPGLRIGAAGPLLLMAIDQTLTVAHLKLIDGARTSLNAKYPKVYSLTVVTGRAEGRPEAAARVLSGTMQQKFAATTAASATVITVSGLTAAIARGFLAGLALVEGSPTPSKVFKSLSESIKWFQALPGAPAELAANPSLAAEVEAFIATPAAS